MKAHLSASEVAKVLKTHRSTVVRWIGKGLVPGASRPKGSREWRVPMEAVQTLLEQHESR